MNRHQRRAAVKEARKAGVPTRGPSDPRIDTQVEFSDELKLAAQQRAKLMAAKEHALQKLVIAEAARGAAHALRDEPSANYTDDQKARIFELDVETSEGIFELRETFVVASQELLGAIDECEELEAEHADKVREALESRLIKSTNVPVELVK